MANLIIFSTIPDSSLLGAVHNVCSEIRGREESPNSTRGVLK